ncbi:MAG: hypothetical protein CME55_06505 [Halieaceae bacterium]|nr:hypothetical protein [Halieaceae bacterium]|tara:strand:+ start:2085 stop:4178 length:2094 start_codon:yes stop_codon:yes gene_type:complete
MECPSCNADNADGVVFCVVCGAELPRSNPNHALGKGKMAVFHVEEALLSNSAGERIARRKGLSGKRFEREVANNLEKAVSRPGVKDFVNKLGRKNHVIAFISSLEDSYQFRLQDRLRQLGYPVAADSSGPLVLMGDAAKNIRSLGNRYDIVFSFGSSSAAAAKEMDVPGVYATVNDYIGDSKNPYLAPEPTPGSYTLSGLHPAPTPGPYTLTNPNCGCGKNPCVTYGSMKNAPFDISGAADMTDEERMEAMGRYQEKQAAQQTAAQAAADAAARAEAARKKQLEANIPAIKQSIEAWARRYIDPELPRVLAEIKQAPDFSSTIKFGTSRAGAPELERLMNDSRDAGYWIGDHLSDLYGVLVTVFGTNYRGIGRSVTFYNLPPGSPIPRPTPPPMPPTRNPPPKPRRQTSKKTGKKRRESAKKYFDRLMGNKMMNEEFPDNSQRSAVALRYVKEEYGQRGVNSVTKTWNPIDNPSGIVPIYSGEPKAMTKNLGAIFAEVVIGRNVVKDVGEVVQAIYRGLIGGRTSMAEKRLALGIASMQKELSDNAKALGGNAVANLKMDYEIIQGSATITIVANADAIKLRGGVKKNPAKPAKVKKAKDAYKKFHGGKTPDEITTEKIDVGDVWYSLGECWTIGYKSPKENGDEEQKFIHEMNEESKDGNFPTLYATMPESGEPMLIIKGGSMKIGMRDGKAWLID